MPSGARRSRRIFPPQTVPSLVHGVRGVVVGTHVPLLEVVVQDAHCPSQATSQQTPCEQTPLAHSVPVVQVSPMIFATHVPLLQTGVFPLQPPQQLVEGMQEPLHGFVAPVHVSVVCPPLPGAPPVPEPPVPVVAGPSYRRFFESYLISLALTA
jgi:hypothetical protein